MYGISSCFYKVTFCFSVVGLFSYNISVMHGIVHLYGVKTETSSNKKSFYICDGHDGMIKLTVCGTVIHSYCFACTYTFMTVNAPSEHPNIYQTLLTDVIDPAKTD